MARKVLQRLRSGVLLVYILGLFGIPRFGHAGDAHRTDVPAGELNEQIKLPPQFPEEFISRDHIHFKKVKVLKSFYFSAGVPVFKIKYQALDSSKRVIWVAFRMSRTHFDIWEDPGGDETKFIFEGGDGRDPLFHFNSSCEDDDILHVSVLTRTRHQKSQYLNASAEYEKALKYFGRDNVRGISVTWLGSASGWELSDNLLAFNHATGPPRSLSPNEAVWETHEGKQARKLGFKHVVFSSRFFDIIKTQHAGNYREIEGVTFVH